MPMVKLERFTRGSYNEEGEDDGVQRTEVRGAPIWINPSFVAALFGSNAEPGASIVRLSDGRGFVVRGTIEDVAHELGLDAGANTEELAYAAHE